MIKLYGTKAPKVSTTFNKEERLSYNKLKQSLYYETVEDGDEFVPSSFVSSRHERFDFNQLNNEFKDKGDLRNEDLRLKIVPGHDFRRLMQSLRTKISTNNSKNIKKSAPKKRRIKISFDEEEDSSLTKKVLRMNSQIKFAKPVFTSIIQRDLIYEDFIKYESITLKTFVKIDPDYKFKHSLYSIDNSGVINKEINSIVSPQDAEDLLAANVSPELDSFARIQFKLYLYSILNESEFYMVDDDLKKFFDEFIGKKINEKKILKLSISDKFVNEGTILSSEKRFIGRKTSQISVDPMVLKRLGLS